MKKVFRGILTTAVGIPLGAIFAQKILSNTLKRCQNDLEKFQRLFLMMNRWIEVKQKGISVSVFLNENHYKTIAIYGMSHVGVTLYNELKNTEIEVAYAIDRRKQDMEIQVYSPDEELADVDAIIVTAITAFSEIADMLEEKKNIPIISLEDILFNL